MLYPATLLEARNTAADAEIVLWYVENALHTAELSKLSKYEGLVDRLRTAVNTAKYVVKDTEVHYDR